MKLRRVVTASALVVVGALGLSACTTHAGAAAQVGSTKIDTSTLRGVVDRGMAAYQAAPPAAGSTSSTPTLERSTLQQRTLGELIYLDLLRKEATSLGVGVSATDLSEYLQDFGVLQFGSMPAFYAAAARSGRSRQDLDLFAESGALMVAVGQRLVPDATSTEADARAFYDQQAAQFNGLPLSFDSLKGFLMRVMAVQTRTASAVQTKLRDLAARRHVTVNPRFGTWTWSDGQIAVVAADGSIATKPAPVPTGSSPLTLG